MEKETLLTVPGIEPRPFDYRSTALTNRMSRVRIPAQSKASLFPQKNFKLFENPIKLHLQNLLSHIDLVLYIFMKNVIEKEMKCIILKNQ